MINTSIYNAELLKNLYEYLYRVFGKPGTIAFDIFAGVRMQLELDNFLK